MRPSIDNPKSSMLVRSSPLAAFPLLPDTECLQLLIEVSLTHGLFDLRALQARAQPVWGVGDGKCNCRGFGHMLLQLRQVHLIEGVGHGMVVDQIIGFL